jgi:hypothetical protein
MAVNKILAASSQRARPGNFLRKRSGGSWRTPCAERIQVDTNSADQASRRTWSCYNPAGKAAQYGPAGASQLPSGLNLVLLISAAAAVVTRATEATAMMKARCVALAQMSSGIPRTTARPITQSPVSAPWAASGR